MTHADGMSQAELARQLGQHLSAGFDRSKVQKMLAGTREISAAEMLAIEEITGFPAPVAARNDFVLVPLIDWAGVAKLSDRRAKLPVENVRRLAFTDLEGSELFATQVEGGAMDRLSPEGSTIIVDRGDRELINGKSYLLSVEGVTTFRRYRAGQVAYFAPYSTDPENRPVLPNDQVQWTIIGRVRRTILDL